MTHDALSRLTASACLQSPLEWKPSADRLLAEAGCSSHEELHRALQSSIHTLLALEMTPEPRPCLTTAQARDILLADALVRVPEFDGSALNIHWPWNLDFDSVYGRSWMLPAVGSHPASGDDHWCRLVKRAAEVMNAFDPIVFGNIEQATAVEAALANGNPVSSDWLPSSEFKSKWGIPPARLRMAANRKEIRSKKLGRENAYILSEVKGRYPADFSEA